MGHSPTQSTPPMGWMSWNSFGPNINESVIRSTADAMVSSGMKAAGYTYILIDDGWVSGRDSHNNLLPDPKKFPHGIKALADYIHSKGLKLGIYSDAAPITCGGFTGSLGFEKQDAASFASWGIDYLKYDYCNAPTDAATAKTRYRTMADALEASGRTIRLGICEWGDRQPWLWAAAAGGTVWRTTGDVRDKWKAKPGEEGMGILNIVDINGGLDRFAKKGHWNDPDMLVVGLYGKKGPASDLGGIGCNDQEYQSQFSLYCIMAAPLTASNDLRNLSARTKATLTNKEAIAIDQDPLGIQGKRIVNDTTWAIFTKPLANGDIAVAILNKADRPMQAGIRWSDLGLAANGAYEIRDVWTHRTTSLDQPLASHETKLLRIKHTITQVSLPHIFSDNMVLQRDHPLNIWGYAPTNQRLTITFHGQSRTTTANRSGKWTVSLPPVSYGGPFEMKIAGSTNTIIYKNVMVGDVWVCSGQSNMEFPISGWSRVNNYQYEIAHAAYPNIRLFTVEKNISGKPEEDVRPAQWQECSPSTISPFSAVGYFFGRELYQTLKIPVGLVFSSWGGTDIESWISRNSLDTSAEYHDAVKNLPVLDMDSLRNVLGKRILRLVENIQGYLPDTTAIASWKTLSFDDSKWPVMQLPGLWDNQQLGNLFDGQVWFRKEFELSPTTSPTGAFTLSLGIIDDNDQTFVNGIPVGSTNGYNLRRIYNIPPGILHEGKNSITIKVDDTGGEGGVYGNSNDLCLTSGENNRTDLSGPWKFQVAAVATGNGNFGPNSYPSLLYNAMIHPLTPFPIKGVIWYQGENNAKRGYQYRKAMPLIIEDWRNHWKEKDFPFYYVQIASFSADHGNSNTGSAWAELRESQTLTLSVPHTGMAVTTDIGEPNDIHPKNKQDVGKRLAMLALKDTYGRSVVARGPEYKSMEIKGNHVELTFTSIGSGLTSTAAASTNTPATPAGTQLNGFELAGPDQKFYPAKSTLTDDRVDLYADEVPHPVAARYAWADDASNADLFNKEGFPATPFRTDQWPESTKTVKYTIYLQ